MLVYVFYVAGYNFHKCVDTLTYLGFRGKVYCLKKGNVIITANTELVNVYSH